MFYILLSASRTNCATARRAGAAAKASPSTAGGLQLDEPAADLALVLAAASSFRDKPIDPATAAIGEVGLTGEIRAVTGLQQRLSEASRTGFKTCIIPRHGTGNVTAPDGMELLRVRNIREAIELVLS